MRLFLCAVIGMAFALAAKGVAQEAKFVDLTMAQPRTALRTTPPPEHEVTKNSDGSYSVKGFAQGLVIGDCGIGANDPRALKTTVTWVDRLSYVEGDFIGWEVEVKNVGTVPMTLATSPNLSDLQPQDASVPFNYEETGLTLSVRDEHGRIDLAHVSVYGSHSQPDTLVDLKVGEWMRLRARSVIEFPRIGSSQTLYGQAVSRFWLRHAEITPAPGTYGTSLRNQCPKAEEGPGMQIEIARKKSEK